MLARLSYIVGHAVVLHLAVIMVLFALPVLSFCQDYTSSKTPAPQRGMSFHDVVKAYGPPLEKKELESRRGDVWTYPEMKVIFQHGRLVAWVWRGDSPLTQSSSMASSASDASVLYESSQLNKQQLESLLGEIVSDLDNR